MIMQVELKKLKPNPFRDFTVDPIDESQVKLLAQSIHDHGFWGGAILRQKNGHIEIAAGHTRIKAALLAGQKTADLAVADISDMDMVRVYATENATQRGNSTTALAGSVASAVRVLAKAILLGYEHLSTIVETSEKGWETARGNLTSDRGIGVPLVIAFLKDVPRINEYTAKEQLSILKKSGHYQRIITEVAEQIEAEQKEAVAALERAEKERAAAEAEEQRRQEEARRARERAKEAKEKADRKRAEEEALRAEADAKLAEKRKAELEAELKKFDALRVAKKAKEQVAGYDPEFDFIGVAKHLSNEYQMKVFRNLAIANKDRLAVKDQAAWAQKLVEAANEDDQDLSSEYMYRKFSTGVSDAKLAERNLSRDEQARIEKLDGRAHFDRLQHDFSVHLRGMISAGTDMAALMEKHRTTIFHINNQTRSALTTAQNVINKLLSKI